MLTKFDYADSILTLERQAIAHADRGNAAGLKVAAESLRAVMADCTEAMKLPGLTDEDREWFQAHHDKAAATLA